MLLTLEHKLVYKINANIKLESLFKLYNQRKRMAIQGKLICFSTVELLFLVSIVNNHTEPLCFPLPRKIPLTYLETVGPECIH